MATTYRGTWTLALANAAVVGVFTVLVGLALKWPLDYVLGDGSGQYVFVTVVVGLALAGFTLFQVRKRSLTLQPGGLVAVYNGVRVTVRWTDFDEVREKGLFKREVLVFRTGEIESAGAKHAFVERLRKQGADRTVAPGDFIADWRTSELHKAAVRTGRL